MAIILPTVKHTCNAKWGKHISLTEKLKVSYREAHRDYADGKWAYYKLVNNMRVYGTKREVLYGFSVS